MTPARQPEHCDHECVCSTFRWDKQPGEILCIKKDCQHDTRPHTSAPAPAQGVCSQMKDGHCLAAEKIHDAAAKAAREQFAEEIQDAINNEQLKAESSFLHVDIIRKAIESLLAQQEADQ